MPVRASFLDFMRRLERRRMPLPDELALARRAVAGDVSAAQALVSACLRPLAVLALKLARRGEPDSAARLFSSGAVALLEVVPRFDPARGVRFFSFASHFARGAMLKDLQDGDHVVQRTSTARRFHARRQRVEQTLRAQGRSLSEAVDVLLAEDYRARRSNRVRRATLEALVQHVDQPPISIDDDHAQATRRDPALRHSLARALSSPEPAPDEILAVQRRQRDVARAVAEAVESLPERDQYFVRVRLAAPEDDEKNLAEIGAHFGFTRENARQIEVRLKARLRKALADFGPPSLSPSSTHAR